MLTPDRSPAGTPRKLICACGEATRLPGGGDILPDPACRAELSSVLGTHAGAACEAAATCAVNPNPTATAGPRMRARMDSIDPPEHKRVDRRTFLKGSLVAGG